MKAAILIGALIVASLLAGCASPTYTCWDGWYAGYDPIECNDHGGIKYEHDMTDHER